MPANHAIGARSELRGTFSTNPELWPQA